MASSRVRRLCSGDSPSSVTCSRFFRFPSTLGSGGVTGSRVARVTGDEYARLGAAAGDVTQDGYADVLLAGACAARCRFTGVRSG